MSGDSRIVVDVSKNGGCLFGVIVWFILWAWLFGVATTWGRLHIDMSPPAVRLDTLDNPTAPRPGTVLVDGATGAAISYVGSDGKVRYVWHYGEIPCEGAK